MDTLRLRVNALSVRAFDQSIAKEVSLVAECDLQLRTGQVVALTGQSGSGKTTVGLGITGLLPRGAEARCESYQLERFRDDRWVSELELNGVIRSSLVAGRFASNLFQDPRASLNPDRPIRSQLRRAVPSKARVTSDQLQGVLAKVSLERDVLKRYPAELSTGMCQRLFVAATLLRGTRFVIADEPFASLDGSSKSVLITTLMDLVQDNSIGMLLISHDLNLIQDMSDRCMVMYSGQVAEEGPTRRVLDDDLPGHPYTISLKTVSGQSSLSQPNQHRSGCWYAPYCPWYESSICYESIPDWRQVGEVLENKESAEVHSSRCARVPLDVTVPFATMETENTDPAREYCGDLLDVISVSKSFAGGLLRQSHSVFDGVSLSIGRGERLGVTGPSGQGKTTLARCIMGLIRPDAGEIRLKQGDRWTATVNLNQFTLRTSIQLVYQDTDMVLDPAYRVVDSMVESFRIFDPQVSRAHAYDLAFELIDMLNLNRSMMESFPFRLSGGEAKRVAIARCLAAMGYPENLNKDESWRLLILDEPTTGLDMLSQQRLCRILMELQPRLRLSYMVISHDQQFVKQFCTRVLEWNDLQSQQSGSRS